MLLPPQGPSSLERSQVWNMYSPAPDDINSHNLITPYLIKITPPAPNCFATPPARDKKAYHPPYKSAHSSAQQRYSYGGPSPQSAPSPSSSNASRFPLTLTPSHSHNSPISHDPSYRSGRPPSWLYDPASLGRLLVSHSRPPSQPRLQH